MSSKERNKKMKRTMLGMTLLLVLGALVLAGCGGSSGGGSTDTSTTTASSSSGSEDSTTEGKAGGMFNISEEAKACLKEKGVELPEFKGGAGEGGPPSGEPPSGTESGEPPSGTESGEKPQGAPPAGGFGGEGNEEMQKAFEECGVETPEFKGGPGGEGGAPNVNSAAFKKQVEEYVACVRENGYEIAEPDFSGEGPVFEKSESESAAFKKASAKCQSLLGGPQK
jgi:hypothetical protein